MTQATIHQAKTHLSKLIQKALAGEEVIIANRDRPVVRLEALDSASTAPRIGGLKHWSQGMTDKFDDPKVNRKIAEDFLREDPNDPLFRK